MYAQTLLDFCHKLAIPPARTVEVESPQGYSLEEPLTAGRVKGLAVADFEQLIRQFGHSLTLNVAGGPGVPALIKIDAGQPARPLTDSLAAIRGLGDPLPLLLKLEIDKAALLGQLDLPPSGRRNATGESPVPSYSAERSDAAQAERTTVSPAPFDALFYLFTQRLVEWLSAPLDQLDDQLFAPGDRPLVILLSDQDVYLRGPFLNIVGLAHLDTFTHSAPAPSSILRDRAANYRKSAHDNLAWLGFALRRLTPLHFHAFPEGPVPPELASVLAENLLHLGILYTANRSTSESGQLQAFYASSEQSATLTLTRGLAVPGDEAPLLTLAVWPYAGEKGDRLDILQSTVARELGSETAADAYPAFVRDLGRILAQARWQHKVFVDRQIDKHFEAVQKATDYVTAAAKGVSDAIDSVTKGLTDSLLAGVGLVILTMLATLIKDPAQQTLIALALKAYAVYLVLFQGLYRLLSILHGYCILRSDARQRRLVYARALGRDKVAELFRPLRRRTFYFWFWYLLTVLTYIGVAAGLWLAASDLAGLFTRLGIPLPPPSP